MHEYDFDEMARHFNEMRKAYMDYRRGGPQPSAQKKLNKFLRLSDIFYRKYPNPFSTGDHEFIGQSKSFNSRSKYSLLKKEINDLKRIHESLEEKIATQKNNNGNPDFIERLSSLLRKTESKIQRLNKDLEEIESSNLPV